MELTPVESSNVAAVGYSAGCRLLRVSFRDGTVYDYPDIAPDVHAALMAAESKGRFVQRLERGVRLAATAPESARPVAGVLTAGPLDGIIQNDGRLAQLHTCSYTIPKETAEKLRQLFLDSFEPDQCCGKPLAKAIASGALAGKTEWSCPECGCEWTATPAGAVRYWSPRPYVEIFRAH